MAGEAFQSYGVGFNIRSNLPIDSRYVAQTVALAKTEIPTSRRYKGLKVYILNEQREYWWKTGITNDDFIPYCPCGGGGGGSDGSNIYVVPTESALDQLPTEGLSDGTEANVSDGTTVIKYYFLNGQWVRFGEIDIPEPDHDEDACPQGNVWVVRSLSDVPTLCRNPGVEANVVSGSTVTKYVYQNGGWKELSWVFRPNVVVVRSLEDIPASDCFPGMQANVVSATGVNQYIRVGTGQAGQWIPIDSAGQSNLWVVHSFSEIPVADRFIGLEANLIENDGATVTKYVLVGGVTDDCWVRFDNKFISEIVLTDGNRTGFVVDHRLGERWVDIAVYNEIGRKMDIDVLCESTSRAIISFCEVQKNGERMTIVCRR